MNSYLRIFVRVLVGSLWGFGTGCAQGGAIHGSRLACLVLAKRKTPPSRTSPPVPHISAICGKNQDSAVGFATRARSGKWRSGQPREAAGLFRHGSSKRAHNMTYRISVLGEFISRQVIHYLAGNYGLGINFRSVIGPSELMATGQRREASHIESNTVRG